MRKCTRMAHVKNSKGEVVVSRLYEDLLTYTSNNRRLTKEYYAVGTNQEFLDKVRDRVEFDENGEITFKSLKEVANIEINKNELIIALNKNLGSGIYEYDEAITKLMDFNRNSPYNNKYMATITSINDGKYQLSVVEKTKENQIKLKDIIAKRTLQDRIKYYLSSNGVAVDFIDSDEKINGRYSTENAEKTADGLYHLIKIVNGESVDEVLAEEAGHFIVGAMNNSPLMTRLLNLLKDIDLQKEILGDDYYNKSSGTSIKREAAGVLIGKSLINEVDKRKPWTSLVNRIINKVKSIFASLKGDDIRKMQLEAQSIADQIASGFMSDKFSGVTEEALKIRETLYSSNVSVNVKTFKKVLETLKLLTYEMRQIDNNLYKKFANITTQVEYNRDVSTPDIFSDIISIEGITEAVNLITDLMVSDIPELFKSVDFNNISDFYTNMARNGNTLRKINTYVKYATSIIKIINDVISDIPGKSKLTGDITEVRLTDNLGNAVVYNLKTMASTLDRLVRGQDGIYPQLLNKQSQFYLRFLEETYGSKYISRSARVVFNFKKEGKLINFKKAENIPIEDFMKHLENDINFFERWVASMSNNPDIVGQIVDKSVKHANKISDDLTYNDYEEIERIKKRFEYLKKKKLISSLREILEVDSSNNLTGNLISELNFGEWEDSFNKMKEEAREEFNKLYPNTDNLSDIAKGILWNNYFKPKYKSWHKKNSVYYKSSDTDPGRYIPNSKLYKNKKWDELPVEVQNLVSDFLNLKTRIDERLGNEHTSPMRVPQFTGAFITEIRNKHMSGENIPKAAIHTIANSIRDTFCEKSTDREYGSNITYNSEADQLFQDEIEFEKDKLNRIPLYGINKLDDMTQLSTDLFGSFLAYANMANKYATLNIIVDTLEVGKDVLNKRSVNGLKTEEESDNKSNAFNRYTKYLDKQIYNIHQKKITLRGKLILNKIAGFFTGLASKIYLGGNVAGGLVNVGTGSIEIFKEALTSEYFNVKDWAVANALYSTNLHNLLWGTIKEYKDDTLFNEDNLSKFIRHFDALSDNDKDFSNWDSEKSKLAKFFNQSLWFPYKSGEHYMQTIPYLALGNHIKLYYIDNNGETKEITLLQAYNITVKDNYKKQDKIDLNSTILYKSKDNIETYNMISDIIRQINNAKSPTSLLSGTITLSQEQEDYLKSKGYNIANLDSTKLLLEDELQKLVWSDYDEINFKNKAREIANRMHGIYNNVDKVEFQQNVYGNALLAMRGYALGMIERRFGSSKFNVAIGGEVSGSILDLAKVIVSWFTDKKMFGLTYRALLLPVGKKAKENMMKAGFSEHQYYNMRRNWADMLFIAALVLLKYLTAKPDDDDDDEEVNIGMGVAYYLSSRLLREQAAFNSLRGIKDEKSSLLDLEPIGLSVASDLTEISIGLIGQQFVTPHNRRLKKEEQPNNYTKYYYNSKKEGFYTYGDSKAEKKLLRMLPYYRTYLQVQNPYEAAASFEWGRKLN